MGKGKEHLFCQFCNRQFRDNTNGFQTHMKSKAHLEKVKEFMLDPHRYIREWSRGFEKVWNDIVMFKYRNKDVRVTIVYDEYTRIEDHVHLHATKWKELMDFVRDWSKRNNIKLWNASGAWWIRYDTSSETNEENIQKTGKRKRTEEEIELNKIRKMVKAAQMESKKETDQQENQPIQVIKNSNFTEQVSRDEVFSMSISDQEPLNEVIEISNIFERSKSKSLKPNNEQQKIENKEMVNNPPIQESHFLPGVIVKVVSKSFKNGDYYNKKGNVKKIQKQDNNFILELEMEDSKQIIKLNERKVESVIPNLKREVIVLKGKYRGEIGILEEILKEKYSAFITILTNKDKIQLSYDDFSKKSSTI